MAISDVSLPVKWGQFLKQLADDHQVDLNSVISELCEWAFSNSEGKKQFEAWLDDAFPPKGWAEDKASDAGARERAQEEEMEEASEEEVHEDRDYNEDRELKP
ncbi:MAG: hypothetical protein NWF00_03855 [Candidatus Bathyarchaeota archaeon]|nr:hypothetical protein [Candidatus Bathyarchaeota archaeon]